MKTKLKPNPAIPSATLFSPLALRLWLVQQGYVFTGGEKELEYIRSRFQRTDPKLSDLLKLQCCPRDTNFDGNCDRHPHKTERTCIYCGCTDPQAYPCGCSWIHKHEHTATGVCSHCQDHFWERIKIGRFALTRLENGKVWMNREGEAMTTTAAKLEAALLKFFKKEF